MIALGSGGSFVFKHRLPLCPNDMSSHVTGATELYAGEFKFSTPLSNVANNPLSNL
jgi:hypothetical protein